jgi:hypothetical protein
MEQQTGFLQPRCSVHDKPKKLIEVERGKTIYTCEACEHERKVLLAKMFWQVGTDRPKWPSCPKAIEPFMLDETIPEADFSRPTRDYYNRSVIGAYHKGLEDGRRLRDEEIVLARRNANGIKGS